VIASILAVCEVMFSPPASWDAIPLPVDAQIIQIPFAQLQSLCATQLRPDLVRSRVCYGFKLDGTHIAYVSTFQTFPGTRECWNESVRHEEAHIKGYEHS
jgi:hypothetical protein